MARSSAKTKFRYDLGYLWAIMAQNYIHRS